MAGYSKHSHRSCMLHDSKDLMGMKLLQDRDVFGMLLTGSIRHSLRFFWEVSLSLCCLARISLGRDRKRGGHGETLAQIRSIQELYAVRDRRSISGRKLKWLGASVTCFDGLEYYYSKLGEEESA